MTPVPEIILMSIGTSGIMVKMNIVYIMYWTTIVIQLTVFTNVKQKMAEIFQSFIKLLNDECCMKDNRDEGGAYYQHKVTENGKTVLVFIGDENRLNNITIKKIIFINIH